MKEGGQSLKYKNIATVIILLLFLLMLFSLHFLPRPPLNPRRKQIVQFQKIGRALEFFNFENNGYPPSDELDPTRQPYCGAMKICEAMMGHDLLGFHPDSVFRTDGMDKSGMKNLYLPTPDSCKARKPLYLPLEHVNVYKLADIYGLGNTGPFSENTLVLCDTYQHMHWTSIKTGMSILYYRANTSHTEHDVNNPDNPENIYNYKDNYSLVGLGVSWEPGAKHPLFTKPKIFYEMTKKREVTTKSIPNGADSFILISAGKDGLYGTPDDIVYFHK